MLHWWAQQHIDLRRKREGGERERGRGREGGEKQRERKREQDGERGRGREGREVKRERERWRGEAMRGEGNE